MKKLLYSTLLLSSFSAFAQLPMEICVVTVDSTLTHNEVVWERNAQPVGIDSVIIYSQDPATGGFTEVGRQDFDSLSEFHHYAANPNLRSYTYAIAGMDVVGNIGPMSSAHSTMHFAVIDTGNTTSVQLKWSPYIGYDDQQSGFNAYQCWADDFNTGTWNLEQATTAMNDTSWWDNQTPGTWTDLWYLVDIDWNINCSPTRANNHNTSRSNKTQPAAPQSLDENILQELIIYPNPSNGIVNLAFSSLSFVENSIEIVDFTGKTVYFRNGLKVIGQFSTSIDVSEFAKGVYFVNITNVNGETLTQKIILQ